jgi:hypothetical protein
MKLAMGKHYGRPSGDIELEWKTIGNGPESYTEASFGISRAELSEYKVAVGVRYVENYCGEENSE